MPYGGLSPMSLPKVLESGQRLPKPGNAACSKEMYVTLKGKPLSSYQ